MGWNLKRDRSERPIIQALEAVGAEVWQVSGKGLPDLLVRFRGHFYCGEVKTGRAKLRASQGAFPVWRNSEEALFGIGAID